MSWVRLHDGVLTHPKFGGLVNLSHPFDLWVWGLTQSQMHLTDGLITAASLPRQAKKAADVLVDRGLWEPHPVGFKVHDYLDWNDARDTVKGRQQKARDRLARWKQSQAVRDVGNAVTNAFPTAKQRDTGYEDGNAAPNQTKPNQKENTPEKQKNASRGAAKDPPDPRVREFLLWFQDEYRQRRNGADYLVKWDRDGKLVKQMLGATTLERLKRFAQIMLSSICEDPYIIDSDRSVQILSTKFNWLSERLAEWESQVKPKAGTTP